jgi:hypothetical protein
MGSAGAVAYAGEGAAKKGSAVEKAEIGAPRKKRTKVTYICFSAKKKEQLLTLFYFYFYFSSIFFNAFFWAFRNKGISETRKKNRAKISSAPKKSSYLHTSLFFSPAAPLLYCCCAGVA